MKKKYTVLLFLGTLLLCNILLFKIVMNKSIDLVEVPYAKVDIMPRTKISKDMIAYHKIPRAYVDKKAYQESKKIVGKYTDISGKIPKGSLFYKSMLYSKDEMPDYPQLLLKDGQTALSLQVDLSKMSGNTLIRHQKVDMYVTLSRKKENPLVDKLLSNVRILSVKDRKGNEISDEESSKVPYVAVLAVKDEYVPYVKLALKTGSIDLYASSDTGSKKEESVLNENSLVLPYLSNE